MRLRVPHRSARENIHRACFTNATTHVCSTLGAATDQHPNLNPGPDGDGPHRAAAQADALQQPWRHVDAVHCRAGPASLSPRVSGRDYLQVGLRFQRRPNGHPRKLAIKMYVPRAGRPRPCPCPRNREQRRASAHLERDGSSLPQLASPSRRRGIRAHETGVARGLDARQHSCLRARGAYAPKRAAAAPTALQLAEGVRANVLAL